MNKSDRKKLQTGLYMGLAITLILCLFSVPYGFYQFARFAAMAIFAYLAYCEYKSKHSVNYLAPANRPGPIIYYHL